MTPSRMGMATSVSTMIPKPPVLFALTSMLDLTCNCESDYLAMRLKRTLRTFVLLCCLGSAGWPDEPSPAGTLPAKEQFHIYLLFGQSNMAGRGALEEGRQPHPRVLKLTAEHTWV